MSSEQQPRDKSALLTERQAKLANALQVSGLDALALNPGPSLTYLTGLEFHLSERPVVVIFIPHAPSIIILPNLEAAKLDAYPLPIKVFTYGEDPSRWADVFRQAIREIPFNHTKFGVEPGRMRILELRMLESSTAVSSFESAESTLSSLRMIKDRNEIAAMQKAVEIAESALIDVLPMIKIGTSEREIASQLAMKLMSHGSDSALPFTPIVASGPNSANPHAFPTDRQLADGDLLIIDWGAAYHGYYSDLTRTFGIGNIADDLRKVASVVLQANLSAQTTAAPGIRAGDVDRAARSVIAAAGYDKFFIHRTGHGLGMEGHEPPYMFAENDLILIPGMTFTIEPGIYLPGRGGVRIEDDFVITPSGGASLSSLERSLIIIE